MLKARIAEARFSTAMTDYWASFIRDGRPAAPGETDWKPYGDGGAYMTFQATPRLAANQLAGMYAVNEEVVCRRRAEGDQSWYWNVGVASPPLPPKALCR
jgi:para-nitrobenzyl esterase